MSVASIEENMSVATNLLKALSNEKRLMIVCLLYRKEMNVGELESLVGLSQSALSQHLARLRRDHLVKTRREAQTIYYSLSCDTTAMMLKYLADVCSCKKRVAEGGVC